jgi:hypothetical protein
VETGLFVCLASPELLFVSFVSFSIEICDISFCVDINFDCGGILLSMDGGQWMTVWVEL